MPCRQRWSVSKYTNTRNILTDGITPYLETSVVVGSMFAHTVAYIVANIKNIAGIADATHMEYAYSQIIRLLRSATSFSSGIYGGEYVTLHPSAAKNSHRLTAD